jgi:hypothetical protein
MQRLNKDLPYWLPVSVNQSVVRPKAGEDPLCMAVCFVPCAKVHTVEVTTELCFLVSQEEASLCNLPAPGPGMLCLHCTKVLYALSAAMSSSKALPTSESVASTPCHCSC